MTIHTPILALATFASYCTIRSQRVQARQKLGIKSKLRVEADISPTTLPIMRNNMEWVVLLLLALVIAVKISNIKQGRW